MSQKIEAFEMWCNGRMQKISWADKITNENVLEKRSLLTNIMKRRKEWMGQILRHVSLILERMVNGKNHRGTSRLQYMSQIIEHQRLKRQASDKGACKLLQSNNWDYRKTLKYILNLSPTIAANEQDSKSFFFFY